MTALELRPTYPVRTERLRLRPFRVEDAPALSAYWSRPDVCRFVPFEPRDLAETTRLLTSGWNSDAITEEGQRVALGIEVAATGQVVGDVMLALRSVEHRSGEIGWAVNPEHGGRGYATEAARALLALGFGDLGLHRIVARIDADNDASCRLAERLGMRCEAHLVENEWFKGRWSDERDYAMLAREWQAARP